MPSPTAVRHRPAVAARLLAALVAAATLALGLCAADPAEATVSFPDVPSGHYAAAAVGWGVEHELTRGVGATGLFMPDRDITRAELVTLLWRSAGAPVVSGSLPVDVPAGHYAATAVRWALTEGVTTGAVTFAPDRPITRAEIVTMMWRSEGQPAGTSSLLVDVPPTHFAATAVRWALDRGITSGVGSTGTFQPDRDLTRAEAITFIWRLRTGTTVAPVVPPVGPHSFLVAGTAGPARWDPCTPIDWHVDTSGALHGNPAAVVPEAVRRLELYTGLDLRQVATAAEADITIRWGDAGGAAGYAQVSYIPYSTPRIVSADVVVDRDLVVGPSDFGGTNSLGVLMLHELAHAVGLGHVDPTDHVMNPYLRPLTNYAVGDVYGLHRVGATQGCLSSAASSALGTSDAPPPLTTIVID